MALQDLQALLAPSAAASEQPINAPNIGALAQVAQPAQPAQPEVAPPQPGQAPVTPTAEVNPSAQGDPATAPVRSAWAKYAGDLAQTLDEDDNLRPALFAFGVSLLQGGSGGVGRQIANATGAAGRSITAAEAIEEENRKTRQAEAHTTEQLSINRDANVELAGQRLASENANKLAQRQLDRELLGDRIRSAEKIDANRATLAKELQTTKITGHRNLSILTAGHQLTQMEKLRDRIAAESKLLKEFQGGENAADRSRLIGEGAAGRSHQTGQASQARVHELAVMKKDVENKIKLAKKQQELVLARDVAQNKALDKRLQEQIESTEGLVKFRARNEKFIAETTHERLKEMTDVGLENNMREIVARAAFASGDQRERLEGALQIAQLEAANRSSVASLNAFAGTRKRPNDTVFDSTNPRAGTIEWTPERIRAENEKAGFNRYQSASVGTEQSPAYKAALLDVRLKDPVDIQLSNTLNLFAFNGDGSRQTIGQHADLGLRTEIKPVDLRKIHDIQNGALSSRALTDKTRRILRDNPGALQAGSLAEVWLSEAKGHMNSLLNTISTASNKGLVYSDDQLVNGDKQTVGQVIDETLEQPDMAGIKARISDTPVLRAIIRQLAYTQALANGNGGARGISDQDIKNAMLIVSGGAGGVETILALMDNLDEQFQQTFNNITQNAAGVPGANIGHLLAYQRAFQAFSIDPFMRLEGAQLEEVRSSMSPPMLVNLVNVVRAMQRSQKAAIPQ